MVYKKLLTFCWVTANEEEACVTQNKSFVKFCSNDGKNELKKK